jgi:hypothetical protein
MTRYSETPYALRQKSRAINPAIAAMVGAVNADTLRATLQEMQNWGSRFLMNDNKKEIATSLVNKFLSYGYTDVKLDSFYLIIYNWGGYSDSSWQYNIVCTQTGSSAPEEIYVVGGHWDSYCSPDPFNNAPGVDDNGTAVAATLEIARVMKLFNYQPEATIQFTLFAAEELGLFGSRFASAVARFGGVDIRYMLNMDMVANNPDNLPEVKVFRYLNFEWAGYCAADAVERYTDLSVVLPGDLMKSGSDSYPYWQQNFPSAYFEEYIFSPNWHLPSDTLGNCNVPYFTKVTGGALATLVEQQMLPFPQEVRAQSTKNDVVIRWKPTSNAFIQGVNIYRSDSTGGPYQKITSAPVPDSAYHDLLAEPNMQYYYVVTTVNDSLQESLFSNEVAGVRFNFCDTLLVLANLKGMRTTPDSIRAFYQAVLDTIPYRWIDINATHKIDLATFSRYKSVFWMSNNIDFEFLTGEMIQGAYAFSENGGNLLFAGFSPGRFWINSNINYPSRVPESSLFRHMFKVDSINRKTQSMMFRAYSTAPGYPTLNVDPLKHLDEGFPGQIFMVDVFSPTPLATVNYRFDSHYDSTTTYGLMKHRPVGLEYMGPDFKSILLSFPLYYLDTADARDFIRFVMMEKFATPVGVKPTIQAETFNLHVFPNPVYDACNVTFTLDRPGHVRISLLSVTGQEVATWLDQKLDRGSNWFRFSTSKLPAGLYEILLQQGNLTESRKMIRIN